MDLSLIKILWIKELVPNVSENLARYISDDSQKKQ